MSTSRFILTVRMVYSEKYHVDRSNKRQRYSRRDLWVLLVVLVWASLLPLVAAQDVSGFISVSCGGTGSIDPVTGIEWVTDTGFLDSASQLADEGIATPALVKLDESTASSRNNAQQLETALAFIPGRMSRSKYCYNFTVSYASDNSTSYLIRATFPSSNLTAKGRDGEEIPLSVYGTRFYFTVDSTFISTIDLDINEPQTVELVVTTLDESLYICLVPLEDRSSMPAISSLELRPLSHTLYPRVDANGQSNAESNTRLQTTYLLLVSRFNFGGNSSSPALRYPVDPYDRLWYAPKVPEDMLSEFKSVSVEDGISKKDSGAALDEVNDTPYQVLKTAWEGLNMSSEITFTLDIGQARSFRPVPTFYVNMMLFDVISSENDSSQRLVDIDLEHSGSEYFQQTKWATTAKIERNRTQRWYNYKQGFFGVEATYRIKRSVNSSLPPMVNAVEVYGEFEAITERTGQYDVSSIKAFSDSFADQVDTAGDPCLPVPWDWLVCSIEIPPRITQINLTGKGLAGEFKFGGRGGSLSRLTVLDVSNNNLYGSLPSTLTSIVTLRALNLAQNKLSGELPRFRKKSLANFESISLRNNSFNGSLLSLVNALDDPVVSLDLSNNNFTGSVPLGIGQLKNLKNLDLSYNSLSGTLETELVKLPVLKNLNLQNNALTGMVPDEIWSSTSKLENVPCSRTYIAAALAADFGSFRNLSGNRFRELNLTTWAEYVLGTNSFDASQQQVSLVANQITNIVLPSQDLFERLNQPSGTSSNPQTTGVLSGFVLLGGNPYCVKLGGTNMTLLQRYLCRSSENEGYLVGPPVGKSGVSTRTLIIVGVTSGLLVLLMACILAMFLWKMGRRTYELRQIQEALAKDDVRPPFYKYEDLRTATMDFSTDNQLGKGAFGAVYKAVLADGSVVAVKRLFPTEQNVADFLKEMVLITGIKHRHLIQLRGCCVRDKQRMLVYEYAENKNLAEALWGKERAFDLTWAQRFNICVGIARGLSYLHEELQPKIIHRDIKPQNILLDKELKAKIADFGLARPATEDATQMASHVGGTLGYFSPEYATLGMFTEKLDVYSYGVLVLEIVSGRRCINLKSPVEEEIYLRTWAFRLYREHRLLDMAAKDLLSQNNDDEILSVLNMAVSCLQEDPSKRPTMSQVVNLLTGNSELAIDIVRELQEQQFGYGYNNDLYDISTSIAVNSREEKEDRALLDSSSSVNVQPNVELSFMRPR